jgi:hypothetical protein
MTKKSVAIVAMGYSNVDYFHAVTHLDTPKIADEIWAINAMGKLIQCDKIFHMDSFDIGTAFSKYLPHIGVPVFTKRAHDDLPNTVTYPLQEVIRYVGIPYFNNTVAYALAYAMYSGFEEIHMYGCDFTYPDSHIAESGRACAEFLMGIAVSRGIRIRVAPNSTLFDQETKRPLYSYGDTVEVTINDEGKYVVTDLLENPDG